MKRHHQGRRMQEQLARGCRSHPNRNTSAISDSSSKIGINRLLIQSGSNPC
ncbi:hypothetical protein DPMN_167888 [Dreissena polymorpha]|uniref:Uncharacterized protein n=1 Tax=Dreissena polymorpha TaxID=45954 RepID=A0A9D4F430_DREPO|nr:hypothetical protein DPMN_167888 [Dreissena polymorpha]